MSSYVVLARKYRPRTFDEVVGQEVVTSVLRGAIAEGRVGHAYLFCGPRGTGKTTTARILAKTLNCERSALGGGEGASGLNPCNECERCVAADSGAEPDIVEIDAASHTGVDDVRALRDQAAYAPMRARHKVYVIDEVHMLSRSAFNALLKTLEEPPAHVIFLFATTEPHKLPDTIVSRCQMLKLDPISEVVICARLREIAEAEGLAPGDGVIEEIARRARGGLRDALSLTDQLIALAGHAPTLDDLGRLAEGSGPRAVDQLLVHVEAGDKAACLGALPLGEGSEGQLLDELLEHLRLCLVAALCGADSPHLAGSEEVRRALTGRAERLGPDRLERMLSEFVHARDRMRTLPSQSRLLLEMTLLELCEPERTLPLAELVQRLAALEERLAGGGARTDEVRPMPPPARRSPPSAPTSSAPAPAAAPAPAPAPAASAGPPSGAEAAGVSSAASPAAKKPASKAPARRANKPSVQPPTDGGSLWVALLDHVARKAAGLTEVLRRRGRIGVFEEGRVVVELESLTAADRRMVRDKRNQAAVRQGINDLLGREVEVTMDMPGDTADGAQAAGASDDGQDAPRRGSDDFTQKVADLFGGTIEESS